jgi:PGF-pre-PGF domain-containing protein
MGGGISEEPASNIAVKELVSRNIVSGYHIRYDFQGNITCIMYIEYDAEKTFRKTTTTVEILKKKSTLVPITSPGKVYENVNVWVGNEGAGLPSSLKNGLVGFKVDKAWVSNEKIDESLITLLRYDKEWQPLYTEKVGEDENYVYFEAKTPGYSSFAITEYIGDGIKGKLPGTENIQETLKTLTGERDLNSLNGSAEKKVLIRDPMGKARMFMAVSLPLFMIIVGYLVLKKKI